MAPPSTGPTGPTGPTGSPEDPLHTEHLARGAVAGDAASRDALLRRVAPALFAWARLQVRPPLRARIDPEDVLQEVTCRVLERFETYDPARGEFRAWVFGIARKVLLRALERLAADPVSGGRAAPGPERGLTGVADPATTLTRAVARDEALVRFLTRLDGLADDDRRLLVHKGLEGRTHEDVAVVLGTSRDAVAKRWQRLCERLRDETRWRDLVA